MLPRCLYKSNGGRRMDEHIVNQILFETRFLKRLTNELNILCQSRKVIAESITRIEQLAQEEETSSNCIDDPTCTLCGGRIRKGECHDEFPADIYDGHHKMVSSRRFLICSGCCHTMWWLRKNRSRILLRSETAIIGGGMD